MDPRPAGATAVYVAYRTAALDLSWLPPGTPVVVVHNDDRLERDAVTGASDVLHVAAHGNVGFGGGVNIALPHVRTRRSVLVNPDTRLAPLHWLPLVSAPDHDVVVVPLIESDGRPTSTLNRYPTPLVHLLSGMRVGRFAPRGGSARTVAVRALGPWGRDHAASLNAGVVPPPRSLATHWPSAAVLSVATDRLLAVGGFDESYFLYHEDVDLARRLADAFPGMRVVVADVAPGVHDSGGSSDGERTAAARRAAAARYAARQPGRRWQLVARLLDQPA